VIYREVRAESPAVLTHLSLRDTCLTEHMLSSKVELPESIPNLPGVRNPSHCKNVIGQRSRLNLTPIAIEITFTISNLLIPSIYNCQGLGYVVIISIS